MRKDHTWIDAQVASARAGVDLRFSLDGEPMVSQRFASRALAEADATRRLRDLQRAGWTTHW